MSHIDTLQVYKDALGAGYTEEQALYQAHILDKSFDSSNFATKEDLGTLKQHMDHHYELIKKDFAGLRWLVLGMGALFAVPIIQNLFITFCK